MLDGGNISGATRLILCHTPPALITNETVPLIQELHQQKGVQGTSPTVTHPKQNDDPAFLDYDDKMLHRFFTGLKTSKGCGPYADNVDIIKSTSHFKQKSNSTYCPDSLLRTMADTPAQGMAGST
eukprot:2095492-Ditylum_brightwellii.AAC.1